MEEDIKKLYNDIKWLLRESEADSNYSISEYKEGWHNGECRAYEIVLEKLERIMKG